MTRDLSFGPGRIALFSTLSSTLLAAALPGGCKKPPPFHGAASASASVSSAPSATGTTASRQTGKPALAPTAMSPVDRAGAGAAYVVDAKQNLFVIGSDGTFGTVADVPNADALVLGLDGRAYVVAAKAVFALDGTKAVKVLDQDVSELAVGRDGRLYFTAFSVGDIGPAGKHVLVEAAPFSASSTWQSVVLGAVGEVTPRFVTVDASDVPWVATQSNEGGAFTIKLTRRDGAAMTPVTLAAKPGEDAVWLTPEAAVATSAGTFVMRGHDVAFVAPGAATSSALVPLTSATTDGQIVGLSASTDGTVVVQEKPFDGSTAVAVVTVPPAKKRRRVAKPRPSTCVAVDAAARIWMFEGNELVVYPAKGKETIVPEGTIPNVDQKVKSCVVIGAGPSTLAPGPARTGTLKGVMMRGSDPVAKADVETCQNPQYLGTRTPCDGSPSRVKTKTDASGAYSFTVPSGPHQVAVKDGHAWVVFLSSVDQIVTDNQTLDIGSLDVNKAKR